ncbi:MAG TPA: hypothetical protein VL486_07695 [Verrucomicrobiae bacterium]|nr:hypothetical protein [Verrucomicrobiae bacterium]
MSTAPQSLVAPEARLGRDVQIGHGTRIYPNAVIGDNCTIEDFCVIGHPSRGRWAGQPLQIGPNSAIRSHAVLYEGSQFGSRLETGHHVLIREGTVAGENLRIGSFSDIEGDCQIGDFCRFHGYVHVGRGSRIGHFVWLYSLTTLTNDPLPPSDVADPVKIEDGCVVAVGATLLPGTILKRGCFVSVGSTVEGHIPSGAVLRGNPGQIVSHVSLLRSLEHGVAHPWMGHYGHNYPDDAQARLAALQAQIVSDREAFVLQ